MQTAYATIRRGLVGSYVSFLTTIGLCTLLYPHIFDHYNYGISYFGAVTTTMIPYYLGLAVTIACLVIIAKQLRQFGQAVKPLQLAFWGAAIILFGVAVTSFSTSRGVFIAHAVLDVALVLNQLVITVWILAQKHSTTLDYILAVVLVGTVVISALPIIHHLPVIRSFPLREVIVFVCALALMGRAALRVAKTPSHQKHVK